MGPPLGNWLALWTGSTGCSAYQIDSNPRSSAFLAINAGSIVYAGSGIDVPMFISVSPRKSSARLGSVNQTFEPGLGSLYYGGYIFSNQEAVVDKFFARTPDFRNIIFY